MSPLAPPENGSQSFGHKTINQRNLIERNPNSKFIYTMDALYEMRHTQSRAPNVGDRTMLESIRRPNVAHSTHNFDPFSHNNRSSTMARFQRERRQFNNNYNRSVPAAAPPPPRHHRNSNNNGQNMTYRDFNGEQQRQSHHGKLNLLLFF